MFVDQKRSHTSLGLFRAHMLDEEAQPLITSPHSRPYTTNNSAEYSAFQRPCDVKSTSNVTRSVRPEVHESPRTWEREKILYEPEVSVGAIHPSFSPSYRYRRNEALVVVIIMFLSTTAVFLIISTSTSLASLPHASGSSSSPTRSLFAPAIIEHSWAAYTPYFASEPYITPPSDCSITQVNIIQRHGARFPTSGASTRIRAAVQKLQSATHYTDAKLDFLKNYTYTLGIDDLVPFGAVQSKQAGRLAYERYTKLISRADIPFVRSSGGTRVVDSATNWTLGFSLASNHIYNPTLSVILAENLNDTLDDNMCPSAGSSNPQTNTWTAIYGAPIAARLNIQAPGSNVTAADISSLIPLCAFESIVTERPSPFCALFNPSEFAQFEYFGDLDKFYGTGYGQALGPVQGVGYINELLSRLTGTPVSDSTQTNRTLDASPLTFPLNRTLYADFSHDNQMIAIYAAMGLFKQAKALDPTNPDPQRTWITSHLTPFSARMVTERLSCKNRHGNGTAVKNAQKKGTYIRILVNDALQPLEFCGAGLDGLCELGAFVESQDYARNNGEGDFEKCFV